MTLAERYDHLCAGPSAICEHLPTLRSYATTCDSVAEFGVDIGQSTTAFLMAGPKVLWSFDVCVHQEFIDYFEQMPPFVCQTGRTTWINSLADSRTLTLLQPVDLLLIDSAHYYEQTLAELTRHHGSVRRWIALHDSVSYGRDGEGGKVGIMPAIREFLDTWSYCWREKIHYENCNGLLILERVNGC